MYRMRSRYSVLAPVLVGIFLAAPAVAQEADPRTEEARRQQTDALIKEVDAVIAGQPAPTEIPLTWHNDFMKALEGNTYVPFTVVAPAGQLQTESVAMYLRVVARNAEVPAAGDRQFAFEDIHFIEVAPTQSPDGYRLSRAFAVPAGEYDVYVAIQPVNGEPRTSVRHEAITVPDFWADELATSSVMVAERVEPLAAPPTPEEQAQRPYALGATEIIPSLEKNFGKAEELSVIFLIYNPAIGPDKKPNVTVEYNFHHQTPEGEKFFNKTSPQSFNAQTLPPQFDLEAGHQLVAGQSVPLATFPEGDFRLEIVVTDENAKRSLTRDVQFTVVGS